MADGASFGVVLQGVILLCRYDRSIPMVVSISMGAGRHITNDPIWRAPGMRIGFGIVLTLLSLLAWVGQAISWLAPSTAVKLTLMEPEDAVEPAFFADGRGEALWDTFTLWTMVVAGVLLIADNPTWAYFGLVGGGMYVYFGGRGFFSRLALRRVSLRIGSSQDVRVGLTFLVVWGITALATIVAAVVALETP